MKTTDRWAVVKLNSFPLLLLAGKRAVELTFKTQLKRKRTVINTTHSWLRLLLPSVLHSLESYPDQCPASSLLHIGGGRLIELGCKIFQLRVLLNSLFQLVSLERSYKNKTELKVCKICVFSKIRGLPLLSQVRSKNSISGLSRGRLS